MPTPTYTAVENSTFLDAYANQQATPKQFADMADNPTFAKAQEILTALFTDKAGIPDVIELGPMDTFPSVTVALVLDRATDASELLSGNWAERQAVLGTDGHNDATWATYGAKQEHFDDVVGYIATADGLGAGVLVDATSGYVSCVENRTVWVSLTPAQFETLFGTSLLSITLAGADEGFPAWAGNLNLPEEIAGKIKGLWVEQEIRIPSPEPMATEEVAPVTVGDGYLGIGNGYLKADATPAAVAANYDFPLSGDLDGVATKPIAVIEANLPDDKYVSLFEHYNEYREKLHLSKLTTDEFSYFGMGGTATDPWQAASEFTLDISVIAGAAPESALKLYGYAVNGTASTAFNAYQRAFFADSSLYAPVLSSSYPIASQPTAHSPFQWAFQQLFVDGALANISSHVSAGDQGSSGNIANGIANVPNSQASPFALAVGGTSIADLHGALKDVTIKEMAEAALQGDPATIFSLVASGLTTLPASLSSDKPADHTAVLTSMFETVWQRLQLTPRGDKGELEADFGANSTGVGGAADGVHIPSYQEAYGLATLTDHRRGSPDVAALAGGDFRYAVLDSDFTKHGETRTKPDGGTSAATPLWAALTAQFNAIFADQRLNQLGYYNDLLYIAAVVAPASFNDILMGSNTNSFYDVPDKTLYYNTNTGSYMIPTGDGYEAAPGYDLVTGLGTPNGELLARALTAIAHSQTSFSTSPDMLDADGSGGWTSGAHQGLLFQTMSSGGATVGVELGGSDFDYTSGASQAFAWTARLAGQSLQSDFDANLVRLFDKYGQGAVVDAIVDSGAGLSVALNGVAADAIQATLSNAFGFADFMTDGGVVRVARAVAVAETAGGDDNHMAVVRVRQNGQDNLAVTFYQADDLAGTVGGLKPGDAGYAVAAQAAAYQLATGGTSLNGPGYGNYAQNLLLDVDAGDFVAMMLVNRSHGQTYWAFSQANPDGQGHLWNYGLNTWGWEDTLGGGDHDFNDMIVQLDFTSTAGNGWLIQG
jgi:hypothetical protein